MKIPKLFLIVLLLILASYLILNIGEKKFEPISFNGDTYIHVDTTHVNRVYNYFFTPNGVALPDSNKFIQLTDFTDPGLGEREAEIIRSQFASTMSLKPLEPNSKRYFGMFRDRHPIYAIERNHMILVYSVSSGFEDDEDALRSHAGHLLGLLDKLFFQL